MQSLSLSTHYNRYSHMQPSSEMKLNLNLNYHNRTKSLVNIFMCESLSIIFFLALFIYFSRSLNVDWVYPFMAHPLVKRAFSFIFFKQFFFVTFETFLLNTFFLETLKESLQSGSPLRHSLEDRDENRGKNRRKKPLIKDCPLFFNDQKKKKQGILFLSLSHQSTDNVTLSCITFFLSFLLFFLSCAIVIDFSPRSCPLFNFFFF